MRSEEKTTTRIRTKTSKLSFARYQLNRTILENVLQKDYTNGDRDAALEFFGGCAFCEHGDASRNDHLVSVIDRGDFVRQNVVPACAKCEDSKGQKDFRTGCARLIPGVLFGSVGSLMPKLKNGFNV